ncbi:hypothetical protein EPD60_06210 [Flaviaesturariibacter flavus]|uniref:Uncharacterized protein n=1 Tax=Flaviaesturariibacter flavus TaxID=2502780 RepID=A0A4R1BKM4_9BACT|nr:hypothetical protein [Flaviaesturariibacter flavus]TCJ17778.1 hypothetical protein EPD60_06210 [Flaviaesturariibacter flavus]
MKRFFTQWQLPFFGARHPAGEPKKKTKIKRKPVPKYPPSPSPESNNLRGRGDESRITPAP